MGCPALLELGPGLLGLGALELCELPEDDHEWHQISYRGSLYKAWDEPPVYPGPVGTANPAAVVIRWKGERALPTP